MVIGGTEGILTVEEGEDLIDPLSLGEMVRIHVPNILAGLLTITLICFLPAYLESTPTPVFRQVKRNGSTCAHYLSI